MTEADGFNKHLAETTRTNPALLKPSDTKVTVTIGAIHALLRSFYSKGYRNGSGSFDFLSQLFK